MLSKEFENYLSNQRDSEGDPVYIRNLPVLEKAAAWMQENQGKRKTCVIALDGRAASGKTTMANKLQEILNAGVIHMDDFFLPISLRTTERFKVPGGNVHYERFQQEVIPYLSLPGEFKYRIFDCSRMDFHGERVVEDSFFRIVEGSYSCHPLFGNYADITVFLDVAPEEQMYRIRKRNGTEMAEIFQKRWIPLEEEYFEAYQIKEKSQLRL